MYYFEMKNLELKKEAAKKRGANPISIKQVQ